MLGRGHGDQVVQQPHKFCTSNLMQYYGSIFEDKSFFYQQAISTLGNIYIYIYMSM